MTRRLAQVLVLAGMISALASCGGSSGGGGGTVGNLPPGFYITISNSAFSPAELRVPAGGTVTVVNRDAMQHSVTSQSAPSTFTPGGVGGVQFDTGAFTGQATFTIPAGAANDTVVPFYCSVHKGAMATPNATIHVDDSAQPGPAPGSSGGGSGY